jgi:ABC-2 type transport system permease protein
MFSALRGFTAVFYKEVLHLRRDSAAVVFALVMPLAQMVILGAGIDMNIRQIRTAICNLDGRMESRQLIDRLANSDTFKIVKQVHTERELNDAIVSGQVKVGLKIPVDYSDHLLEGSAANVLVLIDGSDSSVAGQAMNVSNSIGLDESLQRVLAERQVMPVQMRPRLLFNPDSRSPNFFLPGLMAVLLLTATTFLVSFAIVREKERGTLEQLFVTPVRPLGLLLGKIGPYLALGFVEVCVLLLLTRFAFQVPIQGGTVLLLLLSLPYLFVCLAFGTLVSTKAQSSAEAMQLSFLTFLPSIFFSGYLFPRETMPLFFYVLSFFTPATYYINITRGIILRGAELQHLWIDGVSLLVMGVLMLLIAAKRFQKVVTA